ncbi:MAG: biotin carboxylase N-terminal domain-containing protein [Candidatus Nanopelagicales bacterium]
MTFDSILVANRGEIARRVIRTAHAMGLRTVAVHSDVDSALPFVREADVAVEIGPAAPAHSYRHVEAILRAAKDTGVQAIHPGYGFLSENADFAQAVIDAGLVWVGPPPEAIRVMGDKAAARGVALDAGVPVAPGAREPVRDVDPAMAIAGQIGYPLMVKAVSGGGGMGMGVVHDSSELLKEVERLLAFSERLFGRPDLLLERFYPHARHVEIQVLGLADGRVVALGERDCSVQRRNQKLAEETPSPGTTPSLRMRMAEAAVSLATNVGYRSAGTVECLVDVDAGDFVFLEMNTRLQVEHPITEAVFGIDLVAEQLRIAGGEPPGFDPDRLEPRGHALELRINAEDPVRFLPGPGAITDWVEPVGEGIRVDSGYAAGTTVTPTYDSLMAKLVVHGPDRASTLERARKAVAGFTITGPKSNLAFHAELLECLEFVSGDYDTGIVGRMRSPK